MIRTGVALWTAFNVAWAALLLSPSVASATWDGAKCLQYQLYGKFEFVASNGTSVFNFTSLADSRNVEGTVETVPKNRLDPVWHGRVFGKLEGDKLQLNVYWDAGTTSVFVSTIGPAGRIEGYSYLTDNPGTRAIWNSSKTATCWEKEISARCKQYAETGLKQVEENLAQHCGFKWASLEHAKLTYGTNCMNLGENNPRLAEDTEERNKQLARCRELHQNVEAIDKPDAPTHQLIEKKLGRVPQTSAQKLFPPTPLPICDAARQARARNSPAASGLEAQCRAAGGTPE